MDVKELGLLGTSQEDHWYYASKSRAVLRCLSDRSPERILDVGAGSGFFSKMLLRDTAVKSATCVDPAYSGDWCEDHFGKPLAFCRASGSGDADLVLLMDVLEHVDDDVALLRHYVATARSGTRFILSVPAFSWLRGGHDQFLHHRRRYTLPELLQVAAAAGLRPVTGFYFFAVIFPLVAARRLWQRWWSPLRVPASDLRLHHRWANRILSAVCFAECAVAVHNRAFGLTAFTVAEKV
jgi:SAM-dependent methyltransferase